MKKCTLYCENTNFAKNAQFRLLILPFFTLKMRISKNRSTFFFPHLLSTHKPKMVIIHEEMHPVLRKTDFAKNAQFWLLIFVFYPKNANLEKSFYLPLPPPTNYLQTKNRDNP